MILLLAASLLRIQDPAVVLEGVREVEPGVLRELIGKDLERYRTTGRITALDDAAFRIGREYRTRGFAFVKVSVGTGAAGVAFRVEEGPRVLVGRVHFRGSAALSEEELEATRPSLPGSGRVYSDLMVSAQIQAIVSALRRKGHLDAVAALSGTDFEAERSRMHVTYGIVDGPLYRVSAVEGLPPELGEEAARWSGRPYDPSILLDLESAAVDRHREDGRPFATAKAEAEVDRETARVTVRLRIVPGEAARIGPVLVEGNDRTRTGFIGSRADMEGGAVYRASDLRRAEQRLLRTGLFRQVSVSPGAPQEGTDLVPVVVRVAERPAGEVSVRGGYGTLEGPRVGLDFSYRNLFGGAEYFQAGGTFGLLERRVSLESGVPYVLGSGIDAGGSVYYDERDYPSFSASSYGGLPSLSLTPFDPLRVTGGLRFAVIRTRDVDPAVPPGDLLDFEYKALSLSSSLDLRDDPLLPTEGLSANGVAEWSSRALESDIQFVRAAGSAAGVAPLPGGIGLALGLRGGLIRPVEDTDGIPIALRYFAGGTGTVRGFAFGTLGPRADGEPTGGEAFLALQAEIRLPIWGDLHGAVFGDRGGVWFGRRDVDLAETRYGVGAGLRFYTAAGPIVLDVGWNPRREEDEDPVEAHVSIGFPF